MNLSENFESVKNFAMGAAQTATQKAKVLAAVAKANVSIYAEEVPEERRVQEAHR